MKKKKEVEVHQEKGVVGIAVDDKTRYFAVKTFLKPVKEIDNMMSRVSSNEAIETITVIDGGQIISSTSSEPEIDAMVGIACLTAMPLKEEKGISSVSVTDKKDKGVFRIYRDESYIYVIKSEKGLKAEVLEYIRRVIDDVKAGKAVEIEKVI